MPAIYPIASERVSDLLLQRRLVSQYQHDQRELARLQDQLSTGYRISVPSEDAAAAQRAIALQRLIEQRQQSQTNLRVSQSYVAATENALSGIAELLSDVNAKSLEAVGSTTTDEQRDALALEIRAALQRLVDAGNSKFRGRYLFAGSKTTVQPFAYENGYVVYQGNEADLQSFVDVGFLADTNLTGAEVFGAISPEKRGTADLDPVLSPLTRLADLRGGRGVSQGCFTISDGFSTRTVDLRGAETIGDVARLIELNAPEGRQLTAHVGSQGLVIDIDDAGGVSLTIREVANGTTAAELGILCRGGAGVNPIVGADLNPRLLPTTRLRDLLGVRAQAPLRSAGTNNDILIEAAENGEAANGVQVRFVHVAAAGDQALASYDPVAKTLEIDICPGSTRAATVVEAINDLSAFTARLDDERDPGNDGSGIVDFAATAVTAGGSGTVLDQTSGVQVVNKGKTYTITFEEAETVEDLLNILNGSEAGLLATVNAEGTGLDVRSRVSGADFAIGENGGTTATQLGIRTLTRGTLLAELNYGLGVQTGDGAEFAIRRRDGVTFDVDISSAITLGDVLDLINNHPDNVGNPVVARLPDFGNGIELYDANAAGAEELAVLRRAGAAAWDLGLIPRGQTQATAAERLCGSDPNPQETKSVFNTLLRLIDGLADDDLAKIERAAGMLEEDYAQLSLVRADLGTRSRTLEVIRERADTEDVEIRASLSGEIDADMVEVISELAARQATLQASLQTIARTVQLTLLDYL